MYELPLSSWAYSVDEPLNNAPGKPVVNARIQRLSNTLPEDSVGAAHPFMAGELELTEVSYAEPYRIAGTIRFARAEGEHVNGVLYPAATASIEFALTLEANP